MRVEEIKVMQYEELSDSAKESAKDWYRSVDTSYNWWDDALASIKAFADVSQQTKEVHKPEFKETNLTLSRTGR